MRETTLSYKLKVHLLSFIFVLKLDLGISMVMRIATSFQLVHFIRHFVNCRDDRYHHLCLTMKVLVFK